eukprot:jgi/Tetstr1/443218/TSEL_031257.t1
MPSILGRHRSDGAPPERLPLLLPLLLLLLLLLAGGEGAAPRTDGQLAIQAWEPVRDGSDSVVVGLLDGSLAALDTATGELRWRFKSGRPLVSSSASGGGLQSGEGPPLIFPGADGSLYTYQQDGEAAGVQKLPVTMPELVELSPSITVDNALVLGSKQTTVFVLDRRSGRLLKSFSTQDSATLLDADLDDQKLGLLEPGIDWDHAMFVGRDDYAVRSLSMRGAGKQLWNVTFSKLRCLDPGSLFTSPDIDADEGLLADGGLLAAGSDGALYRMEPDTGRETWAVWLGSHPVGAFMDGRGQNLLLRSSAAQMQRLAQRRSKRPWRDAGVLAGGDALLPMAGPKVMLGRLERTGDVYVLPMDSMAIMDVSPGQPGALPTGPGLAGDPASRAGGALGEDDPEVLDLDSTDGGMDALGGDLSCPYPMGLQTLIEAPCDADFIPKPMLPNAPPAEALPAPPPPRWGPWPPGWVLAVAAAGVALPLLAFAAALRAATPPPPPPPPAEGGKQAEEAASATSPSAPEAEPQAEPQPPGSGAKSSSKKKRKGKGGKGAGKGPAEPGPAASEEGSRHSHSHGSAGSSGGPLPGERAALLRERYDEPGGIVCIGRMRLDTARTLGMGSAGTVVYEGTLDGRRVAIKRLLSQFYDLARKELDTLVRSDDHPNVVRCFALEEDREFVYLALELCSSSLADLVERARGTPLLIAGGQPTPLAMSIAAEVTAGLAALHARGIVHRDLKPANVLMTEGSVAKVSDMGLCKRLVEEQSSFESVGPGGSSGWQAPEQLRQRLPGAAPLGRQTKSIDVFSLGCVLYYCFTGGRHPFGDERFARDGNIITGSVNLAGLAHLPLHRHLISCMLLQDPNRRPSMRAVQSHPVWWPPAQQLAFLVDLSDRVESEDREVLRSERALLNSLESQAKAAIGGTGDWQDAVDALLLNNLGKFRKYSPHSLRDLLRVVRNKNNHFREMPAELQALMGPQPEGYLAYFAALPQAAAHHLALGAAQLRGRPAAGQVLPGGLSGRFLSTGAFGFVCCRHGCAYSWGYKPPRLAPPPPAGKDGGKSEAARPAPAPAPAPAAPIRPPHDGGLPPEAPPRLPERPGETLCAFYERTGFFMKTGGCLYGQGCKFHHPPERAVKRNADGFPLRYGAEACPQYVAYGRCGQGWFCKFHHPELG